MTRTEDGVVYTPPDLALFAAGELYEAEQLAGLGCARMVWDPCCGTGALLDACRRIDGLAVTHGIDLDAKAVVDAGMAGHTVTCADLFDVPGTRQCRKLICNPPYVGKSNISRIVGAGRFKWLKATYPAERAGCCDLAGYVMRHVLESWRPVVSTWIVTNTIAQGSTRRVGLQWACTEGDYKIVSCIKNIKWPGAASVTVHVVTLLDTRAVEWPQRGVKYEPDGEQLFATFCRTARS